MIFMQKKSAKKKNIKNGKIKLFFFSLIGEIEEVWLAKARLIHPAPFDKPILHASGALRMTNVTDDYAEYMRKKYEYEQWENLIILTARKLKLGQMTMPSNLDSK